jgi:hypothetical protein
MSQHTPPATDIKPAIAAIQNFVKETTGQTATLAEIARALTRYFVLNEIKDHIVMERHARSRPDKNGD